MHLTVTMKFIYAFVECPKVGYYNGSECCPSEKCQNCNLDTWTCLECKPGYQGLRCELGNIIQILVKYRSICNNQTDCK